MEASSPLAALHRPISASAWGNRDLFRPRPHSHYSGSSGGLTSLSLREQLHKNTADYFSVKEVRGSSPAASLAADLSQNFRLDNEARLVESV
jgi:M-phase inducer tyrosine phosphatase